MTPEESREYRRRKRLLAFFNLFVANPDGMEVLAVISEFCGEFEDNFVHDNERLNAYRQGRRSVMLEIRNMIEKSNNKEKGR